jgi:hypothetical protein
MTFICRMENRDGSPLTTLLEPYILLMGWEGGSCNKMNLDFLKNFREKRVFKR